MARASLSRLRRRRVADGGGADTFDRLVTGTGLWSVPIDQDRAITATVRDPGIGTHSHSSTYVRISREAEETDRGEGQ